MSADIITLNPEHVPPAQEMSEIADMLRGIADEIDAGNFPHVHHAAVILDSGDDTWVTHRTIGHFTRLEWIGLLHFLIHRDTARLIE